ncbi:hypothetical protein MMC25_005337 [Agyrium rufum]|nr:hypothetical protein [Agyrium rufum]
MVLPSEHPSAQSRSTWIIIGASRGIGLELVKQLLSYGQHVIATVRDVERASQLWAVAGRADRGACQLLQCDVTSETSINNFVHDVSSIRTLSRIDYVVLNAGILKYPNRATEISFNAFDEHMRTNAIGPVITAQKLLKTGIPIGTMIFMSSDSGSATVFRAHEDGFAAYAASKAALNQALRHMAAELKRQEGVTTILAIHPGEVSTDMADIEVGWQVDGIISASESVAGILRVVTSKSIEQSGTFWTWEDKVCIP